MVKEVISPKEALAEMKKLRRRLTTLEKNLIVGDKKNWVNVSREVNFKQDWKRGKIDKILIFHRCWHVATLYWDEFPDFRVNSSGNYQIEWIGSSFRILWDGKNG